MIKKLLIVIFAAQIYLASVALAQISLIRDAQTEKLLYELANPIFAAAKLDAKNINIYIVNDDSLNAFVSGGQNVFINIGLIQKYQTPNTLIGVIAHEVGHIKAGHLARSGEAYEKAQGAMLLTYLLGAGAVLAGAPDAGIAIITGGMDSAGRLFLKFNRAQEEAADLHAIKYLAEIQYPPDGLVKLLEYFQSQMIGYGKVDEYLQSHPVSKKRIDVIKNNTKDCHFSDKEINQKLQREFDIVQKKLEGFTKNPSDILKKYQDQNDELADYIKAIAYFRKGEVLAANSMLNKVIIQTKNQEDLGFLFELKGQILFESGDIKNSIIFYDKAIKLIDLKYSSQAKVSFATAILTLNSDDKKLINLAIKNLEEAEIYESKMPFLFKQLANAYDKIGNEWRSFFNLAKYNLLSGDEEKAKKYAKKAKEKFEESYDSKNKILATQIDDFIESIKSKD
jgi:predicted Zn-dependent protease